MLFHDLSTIFLQTHEFIQREEIVLCFNEVVRPFEVLFNREEFHFGEERAIFFKGVTDSAFRQVVLGLSFEEIEVYDLTCFAVSERCKD